MQYTVEREIGGKKLTIQTGKYAQQANAAVTVQLGDSIVLTTACMSPVPRANIDFLPLTVDYEERLYAAGRIPGSFFRREGRPSQEATLFARLTDRPLRPLFPKGFHNDVQIVITVLSVDKENPPEVLGIMGASAAIAISDIPCDGPVGATRLAHLDGNYTINPTYSQINQSDLNVVLASTRDAVMMVEAGANEVSEEVVLEAMRQAQEANHGIIEMIEELVSAVGKPNVSFDSDGADPDLETAVNSVLDGRLSNILEAGLGHVEQEAALRDLNVEVQEHLSEQYRKNRVADSFESELKKLMRTRILEKGVRPDGREPSQIRPITCEVGIIPRTHGSGLFTRGQTQVLTIATLASKRMQQTLDTLSPEESKRFMHHYNFTPYSTGEVKRVGSPGRREVGHGALAERAILPALPGEEDFPYTIRLVSEVLSSNGSTSMASVCGSSLALMDTGVPMKNAVAGIAMGLIMGENGQHAILTDIQGIEDHLGDMDFKVAGTARGINALQMDIKTKRLSQEILEQALKQAREGRLYILDKMGEAIASPRPHLSPYAPKLVRIVIPVEKIGAVIGSSGRTIRSIQEDTGANIDVSDDGTVIIGATGEGMVQRARDRIESLVRDIVVGDIFTGKVVRLTSFGAFLELLPGKDGLLRTTEMGDMDGGPEIGQEVTVIVIEVDSLGRVNVSRRSLQDGSEQGRHDGGERFSSDRPARQGVQPSGPPRPGFRTDRRPPEHRGPRPPAPGQGRRPPSRPTFRDSSGR